MDALEEARSREPGARMWTARWAGVNDPKRGRFGHVESYPQLGSFRFFGSVFGLHFWVFDIDNAVLVVKKLGSFCENILATEGAEDTEV
jgi:hypothetical protein